MNQTNWKDKFHRDYVMNARYKNQMSMRFFEDFISQLLEEVINDIPDLLQEYDNVISTTDLKNQLKEKYLNIN